MDEEVALLNQLKPANIFCFPPGIAHGIAYDGLASVIEDYSIYGFNFIEDDHRINQ